MAKKKSGKKKQSAKARAASLKNLGKARRAKKSGGGSKKSNPRKGPIFSAVKPTTRMGQSIQGLGDAVIKVEDAVVGITSLTAVLAPLTGRTVLHLDNALNTSNANLPAVNMFNPFTGNVTQQTMPLADAWGALAGTDPQFAGHPGTFAGNVRQWQAKAGYNVRRLFTKGTRAAVFGPPLTALAVRAVTPIVVNTAVRLSDGIGEIGEAFTQGA